MAVRSAKRVAKIVFRSAGIARNFRFHKINNALEQLCFRMLSIAAGIVFPQAGYFGYQSIEGFAKSRMGIEPPVRFWRLLLRHSVTSSGSNSLSLTSTCFVNSRASAIRVAEAA